MADNLSPYYADGTATLTAGSAVVAGQGTTWQTNDLRPGDQIESDAGERATILSIDSATAITLDKPWRAATQTAKSYKIWRTFDAQYLMGAARSAFDLLGKGGIQALAGLQIVKDKIPYGTGPNTLGLTEFPAAARSLLALAAAADKLPYFTSDSEAGVTPLTAFARSLLDDADASSARTTLGAADAAHALTDYAVNLYPDAGRFGGTTVKGNVAGAYEWPSYLLIYNSSTQASIGKFISDNNDYGGTGGALNANVKDLIDKIRGPAYRRYGVEFHVAQITMGAGRASSSISIGDGKSYYLSLLGTQQPRLPRQTFHLYIRALDNTIALRWYAGQTFFKDGVAIPGGHMGISPAEGWVSFTCQDAIDPYSFSGYSPTVIAAMCANTGDRYLVACPALIGGIGIIDKNSGIIPSATQWT